MTLSVKTVKACHVTLSVNSVEASVTYISKLVHSALLPGCYVQLYSWTPDSIFNLMVFSTYNEPLNYKLLCIDLFILKNMGAAIIDFRVCPPLVKCQNLLLSGFIDMLMYGFSSTGVTIYCHFGLKFNDNTCCEVICKRRYNDNDIMTIN